MMTPSKSASLSVTPVPKRIQKRVTYQPTSAILWWWYEAPAIELQASHFPESLKLAPMFRLLMVQLKAWVLQQNTISCNENIWFSETIFLEDSLYTYTSFLVTLTWCHCRNIYLNGCVNLRSTRWSSSRSSFDMQALVILRGQSKERM